MMSRTRRGSMNASCWPWIQVTSAVMVLISRRASASWPMPLLRRSSMKLSTSTRQPPSDCTPKRSFGSRGAKRSRWPETCRIELRASAAPNHETQWETSGPCPDARKWRAGTAPKLDETRMMVDGSTRSLLRAQFMQARMSSIVSSVVNRRVLRPSPRLSASFQDSPRLLVPSMRRTAMSSWLRRKAQVRECARKLVCSLRPPKPGKTRTSGHCEVSSSSGNARSSRPTMVFSPLGMRTTRERVLPDGLDRLELRLVHM